MDAKSIPVRQSLSYQQTKQTVIVAFIIGLVLSTVQIVIDYFSEQQKLSSSVSNILNTANSTAFHAAFNIDETGAQQIAEGLVSNAPIIEATIVDNFGTVLGTAKAKQLPVTSSVDKLVFGSLREIKQQLNDPSIHSTVVGELKITIDPSLIADSFMQRAGVVFVSGIVRNTILALAIFWVFYLTFTKSILQATLPILKGRDKMQIDMPENHKHDEIGALIETFNDHLSIIDEQNKQIRENNTNLEAQVSERTEQLNERNRELEFERSMAIEASLAKSDFLAMMSHEIRTPMNGILGMAELLEKKDKGGQNTEYLNAIVESSKAMLSLMNSVLDYSKYEKSQISFEQKTFEVEKLVNSIVFLLSASAEKKQTVLSLSIDENVPKMVVGDPEKLRQVLLNIITNAIKFTKDGTVAISVGSVDSSSANSKCSLSFYIEDTGIGIDQHEIEHIFEPYTQANSKITQKYGGTGMGLAICRAIIEQQGGQIAVNSTLSQGTQFSFSLPFDVVSELEHSTQPQLRNDGINYNKALKPLHVLVVDDLRINRKLLQGQLEVENHRVTLAESGEAALEIIDQNQVDVMLLDLHMPEMDGIETTHAIREGPTPNIPIVGVTANVSEQKLDECLSAGMNLVITKPVDQRMLMSALNQIFSSNEDSARAIVKPENTGSIIDQKLAQQHLDALGLTKFSELYKEAKVSASRRVALLTSHPVTDFETIKQDAHALVGLCSNFGLSRLSSLVEEIELAATNKSPSSLLTNMESLEQELSHSFNELATRFPDVQI